ncbi:histidine phosphatase family protein [Microbulbifer epialgicus]|uniref:Histidine phosphatase family protein n=1 Tax=Microbulbifer epialgicus TaxID=393907 RepID=A0ABV4P2B5_9GAMM
MTRIFLVRHGEAEKGANIHDPTLTKLGQQQATALAQSYSNIKPLKLISSPKLRAQQTAQPLANTWNVPIIIEESMTEIPTPCGLALQQRIPWVRDLINQEWNKNDKQQTEWRERINNYLLSLTEDSIIFCHFMVINSVIATIRQDCKVQQFRPDYTSMTKIQIVESGLVLMELGNDKESAII